MKPNDEKIIAALLSTGSVTEAEKQCAVSRRTIYTRLSDPAFRAEYDARRKAALDGACDALRASLSAAITTVREIILDKKNAPQVRLNAAQIILQNAIRYGEQVELAEQVERLESMIGGRSA